MSTLPDKPGQRTPAFDLFGVIVTGPERITVADTSSVNLLRMVRELGQATAADVAAKAYGSKAALGSWVSPQLQSLSRQGMLGSRREKGRMVYYVTTEGDMAVLILGAGSR